MQQILIIGLGKFGMSLARSLAKYDCEVMAIDNNPQLVDDVSEFVTHAARVDAADVNALKELGVSNFDVAVIGIGDDLEASIMIALTLKELEVPYIVAKSRDDVHAKLLTMIGVDRVIEPEREIGARLAKTLMHKNVIERMEVGKEYSIAEVDTPREWIGSRLNQLNIRPKYNINILCIEKEDKRVLIPSADYVIEEGDTIMLIAPNKELDPNGFLGRLGNFLDSLTAFAAECYLHYINKGGDMELPDEQWAKIQKLVSSIKPSENTEYKIVENDNTYYVMSHSFYETEFANALGTATLTFNSSGTLIGLYDLYDFNLNGATRPIFNQALTFLGSLIPGESYKITKGKYFTDTNEDNPM